MKPLAFLLLMFLILPTGLSLAQIPVPTTPAPENDDGTYGAVGMWEFWDGVQRLNAGDLQPTFPIEEDLDDGLFDYGAAPPVLDPNNMGALEEFCAFLIGHPEPGATRNIVLNYRTASGYSVSVAFVCTFTGKYPGSGVTVRVKWLGVNS